MTDNQYLRAKVDQLARRLLDLDTGRDRGMVLIKVRGMISYLLATLETDNHHRLLQVREELVDLLRPFDRGHGSLYDRGKSDSYYHRKRDPHWRLTKDDGRVVRIDATTEKEIAEYNAGYDDNEADPDARKDYGRPIGAFDDDQS